MTLATQCRRVSKYRFARQMRENPSPPEELLWSYLQNRQLGYIFQQQVVACGYILDFYCPSKSLAIEIDGNDHRDRVEYDCYRDAVLREAGIRVLHFPAHSIFEELEQALATIHNILEKL